MENLEFSQMWKSQDDKLNHLISINHQLLKELSLSKSAKMLNKARPVKFLGIIIGIPWIIFLNFVVFIGWKSGALFLMFSAAAVSIFTTIALGTYVYHLILIYRANYADSVLVIQENIAKLKTSSIKVLRILVLQIPFWQTMFISYNAWSNTNGTYRTVTILLTALFTFLSIWLFRNIKIDNLEKKWLKWLFTDGEWSSIVQADQILRQFQDLKD